jgi:hypothetical protein
MSKSDSLSDRRRVERRKTKAATLMYGHWLARRRHARREHDQRGYYVDWYEPHLLCLIIGILLLSCADALLTLRLLELGGRELNAFMAMLIHIDAQLFAALKMAFTGASLLFLVIHQHFRLFRRLRVDYMLRAVLVLYLLLIAYELVLLTSASVPAAALIVALLGIAIAIMGLYLGRRARNMAAAHTE